jgi:hypothetical protein
VKTLLQSRGKCNKVSFRKKKRKGREVGQEEVKPVAEPELKFNLKFTDIVSQWPLWSHLQNLLNLDQI